MVTRCSDFHTALKASMPRPKKEMEKKEEKANDKHCPHLPNQKEIVRFYCRLFESPYEGGHLIHGTLEGSMHYFVVMRARYDIPLYCNLRSRTQWDFSIYLSTAYRLSRHITFILLLSANLLHYRSNSRCPDPVQIPTAGRPTPKNT